MMIFIDLDFRCHTEDDGSTTAVETDFFNGKCPEYIKGFRFVPEGYCWVREDGAEFQGKMIAPWKDYDALAEAQREYEFDQLKAENAKYEAALAEIEAALGVGV